MNDNKLKQKQKKNLSCASIICVCHCGSPLQLDGGRTCYQGYCATQRLATQSPAPPCCDTWPPRSSRQAPSPWQSTWGRCSPILLWSVLRLHYRYRRQILWVACYTTTSHCASLVFQGYYVRNNMLGPNGDFITSPEISQIFGEVRMAGVIGVSVVNK